MVHVFLTLTVCPWVGNVSCQPAPVLGVNWFHEVGPWRGAGVRGGGGRCRGVPTCFYLPDIQHLALELKQVSYRDI